ncbi:hypothetical protein CASFOL_033378 [Castilleja foliolosa]|uniref:Glycine cleavage system H protein n=1 Tax=Castilleja foliolosa TaxID=1961234 RepID=A0ABD3BZ27_9LAMI
MASRLWATRAASFFRISVPHRGFATVKQNKAFGAINSVNKSSKIYTPISGKVVQVNTKLKKFPRLVNESPYEDGWILKVQMKDSNELNNLMDSDQYSKFCETAFRPRSLLDLLFNRS